MAEEPTSTELAAERVAEWLSAGKAQLIDTRHDYEWEAGRIAGARHVEMNELRESAGSISRERAVVFCCRAGNRSALAADAFRQAGYDAYHLAGGISAWAERGLPIEPEDGEVAKPRPV